LRSVDQPKCFYWAQFFQNGVSVSFLRSLIRRCRLQTFDRVRSLPSAQIVFRQRPAVPLKHRN